MKRTTEHGAIIWSDSKGHNHRLDGPAIIRPDGAKFWYKNGKRHRIGGPACYGYDGEGERWYRNGHLHRTDGPAINFNDGKTSWYIAGRHIETYKHLQELTRRSDIEIILLKLKWGKMQYWPDLVQKLFY